jgi:signal transduction histidine kinase
VHQPNSVICAWLAVALIGSSGFTGLAIAAEIASAHGGTAPAAPVSPHGLLTTLTLPVRRPSGPRSVRELAASVS